MTLKLKTKKRVQTKINFILIIVDVLFQFTSGKSSVE
jgi:hypothetical protein